MEKQQFIEDLIRQLPNYLPAGQKYNIILDAIPKNNGITQEGVIIKTPDCTTASVFYADRLYSDFEAGRPMEEILDAIAEAYVESVTSIQSLGQVQSIVNTDKIYPAVINYEANKAMLAEVPHIRFGDLAVVCRADATLSEQNQGLSVLINDAMLELLNLNKETMFAQAMAYAESTYFIQPLADNIMDTFEGKVPSGLDLNHLNQLDAEEGIYIITNTARTYGAAAITSEAFLSALGDRIGSFHILPSSVNEILALSVSSPMSDTNLAHTVQTVNKQHVAPVDILSDNIYHWDAAAKQLTLITANQRREKIELPNFSQAQTSGISKEANHLSKGR